MPGNTGSTDTPSAPANLSLRRDGKVKTFSHIRRAWFVEYPEEVVRQQYVCTLVNDYGYSLAQMDEEWPTQHGRGTVEADIVIWRTVQEKADAKTPLIVVECKSDNITIDVKDYHQGESYARNTFAPFFVTHNNRETRYWRIKRDRMPGYVEEITGIPRDTCWKSFRRSSPVTPAPQSATIRWCLTYSQRQSAARSWPPSAPRATKPRS
jgi:Type I restriction enzyme R protein N terminus (HSDR_N)